jgi:hypothetical protein
MSHLFCYKNKFDNDNIVIKNTCALLYDYYVDHHGWNISKENPSGITIKTLNGKNSLVDNYDQYSIFFSVTNKNGDILSCARLCAEDEEHFLEIEKYKNAKECLQHILIKKQELNILEMAREGINLNYLDDEKPYLLLLREVFNFCLNGKHSLLTTTNLPEWEKIYKCIGFPELENVKFKYFDDEPTEVKIYFSLASQAEEIIKRINLRLKRCGDHNG